MLFSNISDLENQYAFKHTGSTTAALIAILDQITSLLKSNAHVHLISFDYSKAFDTITHGTVAEAIAKIEMPDSIYNWIIDYLY